MNEFEGLGLSKQVLKVLDEKGFKEPSEIQKKAIPVALKGRDIIGGSATGSGKTLAFASPIIENLNPNNHVQALILTPTRELAEQVANSITKFSKYKHLNVLAVYGGVDIEKQIRTLFKTDVLVGTPGRILDHLNRRTLRLDSIKFLVLDEVDRMFDMGFHVDVEKIIKQCPEKRQTMMFSATISSEIDYLAKKYTHNPKEISVEQYVDYSKLKQIFYDVPSHKKFSLLVHLLKKEKSELVMIFCSTRKNVDFISKNLGKFGVESQAIHGGLEQNKRTRILKNFHGKGVKVLVCTDVAARGLDIKGVSHVYNYDLPKTADDYVHRVGRTARAGEQGEAINILSSRDYENFSNIRERKELKIESKELPHFETVRVEMESLKKGRFDRGERIFKRPQGRSRFGRREESKNDGPRRTSFHRGRSDSGRSRFGRREESKNDGPRRTSFHRGRSDSGRSRFGSRNSELGGRRKFNRPRHRLNH